MKLYLVVITAFIMTAACAVKPGQEEAAEVNTDRPGENVIFKDDFDGDLSNWVVEEWDGKVKAGLKDGQLHVTTESKYHGGMIWCRRELPGNFRFEYDVTPLSASGFFLVFFCTQGLKGEDILSEEPHLAALGERHLSVLHGNGVLRADVDDPGRGADGVRADQHALDHKVRVTLQQRPVHERAGIALIRVAHDILRAALGLPGKFPLQAGWKTGAAAASEFGSLNLIDDLFGGHF